MEDTTNTQAEQTRTTEVPGTGTPTPDERSDLDELKEASQQFFSTLFRVGAHVALTPVSLLPEESREHFASAVREFTRGLTTLAHELADNVDKIVEEAETDVKKHS